MSDLVLWHDPEALGCANRIKDRQRALQEYLEPRLFRLVVPEALNSVYRGAAGPIIGWRAMFCSRRTFQQP